MTAAEQHAFDEGKLAAFADSKPHAPGQVRRCPFRRPELVAKWREGYDWQVAATRHERTPEEEAKAEQFCSAITDWLARNR